MQDLQVKQNGNGGCFDLTIVDQDFGAVDGLETSVALYLFSDARASSSQQQQASKRRGWIGNIFRLFDLGSLLWLLTQSRNTADTGNKAKQYAVNALNPLIRDGLASEIKVEVLQKEINSMQLEVEIIIRVGQVKKFTFWLDTKLEDLENVSTT